MVEDLHAAYWPEYGGGLRNPTSFLEVCKGLVDELVLYQAPKLLGDEGRGLFHLPELTKLFQAPKLQLKDVRLVGQDIRITAKIA